VQWITYHILKRSKELKHRKGFTLIELLIVIAIILILAAILFPVFLKAREKANTLKCLSNMKQLAIACISYSTDYDDCFVNLDTSTKTDHDGTGFKLYPYVKDVNVYRCPTLIGDKVNPTYDKTQPYNWPQTYALSGTLIVGSKPDPRVDRLPAYMSALYDANGAAQGVRMSAISRPSQTICWSETTQDQPVNTTRTLNWDSMAAFLLSEPYLRTTGAVWSNTTVRHNWGGNMAFTDGHAEYFSWPQGYHVGTSIYWVTLKYKSYAWWKINENENDPAPISGNE